MNSIDPALTDMQRAIREALRVHWRLFMAQGVIMVILGILAIVWPMMATFAVDIYVGWLFLISGIVGLVAMFSAEDVPAFLWTLLTAAVSLIAGVLLLWKPVEGAVSLTLVLTAFFIAEGIFQIAASISYRNAIPDAWGWMLASGIADLILAAIIISGWPGSAAWTLGLLVGVNLITSGCAAIMMAVAGRNVVKALVNAAR
jgi:uncharacterized membrane protein HdeD (DUF308 family)